jgi:hypothetical protein
LLRQISFQARAGDRSRLGEHSESIKIGFDLLPFVAQRGEGLGEGVRRYWRECFAVTAEL